VAIRPLVSDSEVDSFLINMGWANVADDPFTVTHILPEQSLPPQMPSLVTLRLLFTRFLDINAVPRKSFFALLRHFTTDEMEKDKLDEFLIGPDAAVSSSVFNTDNTNVRLMIMNVGRPV
jgi:sulfite reductase alpha subunit-like flavoprotein